MLSLQNILSNDGAEFLDNLLNKEVIVTEKLNASTLSFSKKQSSEMDLARKLTFYKGTGKNKREITISDSVMTTFYASGMTYLNNLSKITIDRIPANWTFVCKYFPSHQPSFINYSVLPKNNLVLSCVITSSGTKLDDVEDLKSWAEMFDIAYQEPVFRGYLTEYQKETILDYVKDSSHNKDSFSRFIITLLNPDLKHSLYQEDGFDSPIDGFIFKFISNDGITKPMAAKLIDPYMSQLIAKNKSKRAYSDNTDILLADFTVFMSTQDISSFILTGNTVEDRYLELFYKLFNRYIKYKKVQLEDFDVDTNEIVKESIDIDFQIDLDKISNETTKRLLRENPEYKSIFKTLLGSFKTKKSDDYKSIVMSPGVVRMFNCAVDNIDKKTQERNDSSNLSFDSYLNAIKHNVITDNSVNDNATEMTKTITSSDIYKTEPKSMFSFEDFLRKENKREKQDSNEENKLKSIEDMVKDLQDSVNKLRKENTEISNKMAKEKDDESKTDETSKDKEDSKKDKTDDNKEDSTHKDDDKKNNKAESSEDSKDSDDKEKDTKRDESDKDEDSEDDKTSSKDEKKDDDKKDSPLSI